MRIPPLVVAVVGAAVGTLVPTARIAAQDPAPVPLSGEPRHHVVYESAAMRVHDIQIPPGDTTLFHTHDTPILYVPIARSTNRSQVLGGEWSGGAAATPAAPAPAGGERPGRVNSVMTYVEKPFTHRVNNVGTSLFRLVGIANAGPPALMARPMTCRGCRRRRSSRTAGTARIGSCSSRSPRARRTGTRPPSWW